MNRPAGNPTDFDYLASRLHARWSRAVRAPELKALIDSGIPALGRTLANRAVDIARPAEIQKQLTLQLAGELEQAARYAGNDTPAAAWMRCFTGRLFLTNLPILLRQRILPQPEGELEFLLLAGNGVPVLDATAFLAARDAAAMAALLPPTPFTAGIPPLLAAFETSKDLFAFTTALDSLAYHVIAATAAAAPPPMRPTATELATALGDLANLILLMRNAVLYKLPTEKLLALMTSSNGGIDVAKIRQLAQATPEQFTKLLPAPYRSVLTACWESPLSVREDQLWAWFFHHAVHRFTQLGEPGNAAAAYPILRWMEWRNLGRLFEGLRFHLDASELRAMLIL